MAVAMFVQQADLTGAASASSLRTAQCKSITSHERSYPFRRVRSRPLAAHRARPSGNRPACRYPQRIGDLRLPPEMRTIISFDTASVVYVWLFYTLMSRTTAEQVAVLSSRDELRGAVTLVAVVLLSLVSVIAVAALLNNLAHAPHWLNVIHLTTSLLAIALAWLLTNIFLGLHYMALYYRHPTPGGGSGLEFPNHPNAGYWDFMYYSFTMRCASLLRMWSSPPLPCVG